MEQEFAMPTPVIPPHPRNVGPFLLQVLFQNQTEPDGTKKKKGQKQLLIKIHVFVKVTLITDSGKMSS